MMATISPFSLYIHSLISPERSISRTLLNWSFLLYKNCRVQGVSPETVTFHSMS